MGKASFLHQQRKICFHITLVLVCTEQNKHKNKRFDRLISLWKKHFQSYYMEVVPVNLIPQWKTLQDGQHSAELGILNYWIRDENRKITDLQV